MRCGSGIRILTTIACSLVLGPVAASAQNAGAMIVPGRDVKLGAWSGQSQVTQKGAVFQCVVERPLGPAGRKADRLALVIGGGAGWGVQIVRSGWSLDPDKDHDAVILVDGGRTVPVESYALDPNRLAIHPSDVPTFEAYLKRGTTLAIRSRSAGIDEAGLPLDGIAAAIDWLDRCGRQFALHGAPAEGALAKPLAPVGAPVLAAPPPPPAPPPAPVPTSSPILASPSPGGATISPVPPHQAPSPSAPAAIPVAKPQRPTPSAAGVQTGVAAPQSPAPPVPVTVAGTVPSSTGTTGPLPPPATVSAPTPPPASRPLAAVPAAAGDVRPLALVPPKAGEVSKASLPPSDIPETVGAKALLPTSLAPAEPAAAAIGKVVRGKTDRAAVLARPAPAEETDPSGTAQRDAAGSVRSAAAGARVVEPIVVPGERGSIVTAATRPVPDPRPAGPAPTAAGSVPPTTAPTVNPSPASPTPVPAAAQTAPAQTGPTADPVSATPATPPTGPVRVIQGIAAYPSPYAAPSVVAASPAGHTGAATDTGGRVPFVGPLPRPKPR